MRTPKHATVVAYVALFVALGGSAYAATDGNFVLGQVNHATATSSLKNSGTGPALKLSTADDATTPFTVSNGTKISKLNADQVDGLSAGAFQRKTQKIDATNISNDTTPAGGIGPWTFSLLCHKLPHSSGGSATLKITGPGTAGGTHSVADNFQAGNTFVSAMADIGAGHTTIADTNQQVSATLYLRSDTTTAEVEFLLTDAAVDAEAPQNCAVIGAATLTG